MKWAVRISAIAVFIAGLAVAGSTGAYAQKVLGTASDDGITLTVNSCSIVNQGQKLKVGYTIHTSAGYPQKKRGRLMQTPHIWIGDTLVRGDFDRHRKIGPHSYKGVVTASLHQYRSEEPHMSFNTYSILNQKGSWKVDFVLENSQG